MQMPEVLDEERLRQHCEEKKDKLFLFQLSDPCSANSIPACAPEVDMELSPIKISREEKALLFIESLHLVITDPREKEYLYYEKNKSRIKAPRSKTMIDAIGEGGARPTINKSQTTDVCADFELKQEIRLSPTRIKDLKIRKRAKGE